MIVGLIADNYKLREEVEAQIEEIIKGTAFDEAVKLVQETHLFAPGPAAALFPLRKDPETAVKLFNLVLEKVRNRS